MSPYLDDAEDADADDGQADDGYQESATGVMHHGGGEVSTFGLAAGTVAADSSGSGCQPKSH
jgi:hypothetical protein